MPSKPNSTTTRKRIPESVREAVIARIEPELERYVISGEAGVFDLTFRGNHLYVASGVGAAHDRVRAVDDEAAAAPGMVTTRAILRDVWRRPQIHIELGPCW